MCAVDIAMLRVVVFEGVLSTARKKPARWKDRGRRGDDVERGYMEREKK